MNSIDVGTETPMRGPDFASFFAEARPRLVRAMAVTLGDAGLAADSVDEAMARAWDRWEVVRGMDAPAGWVYRVALNHGRSRWRRRRREDLRPTPESGAEPATDPTPLDDDLQQALLDLPHAHREVVVLRLLLDLDTGATAAVLEVAEGTVRSRLARAVAALRSALEVSS